MTFVLLETSHLVRVRDGNFYVLRCKRSFLADRSRSCGRLVQRRLQMKLRGSPTSFHILPPLNFALRLIKGVV